MKLLLGLQFEEASDFLTRIVKCLSCKTMEGRDLKLDLPVASFLSLRSTDLVHVPGSLL